MHKKLQIGMVPICVPLWRGSSVYTCWVNCDPVLNTCVLRQKIYVSALYLKKVRSTVVKNATQSRSLAQKDENGVSSPLPLNLWLKDVKEAQ